MCYVYIYVICVFIYLDEIRTHICIMYVGKQHHYVRSSTVNQQTALEL